MAGGRDAGPMAQGGGALSPALLQGYFLFAARRSALALEHCIAWAKSRRRADDLLAKASLADGGLGSLSPDELSRVGKPAETEFLAAQNRFESSLREAKRDAGLSEEQAKWLADIEEAVRDHRLAQKTDARLIPGTEKRLAEVRATYGAAIVDTLLKSTKELEELDAAEARVRERCDKLLDD